MICFVFKGSRLPRNNIEFDPEWQAAPAEAPHLMKWINKRLELTAYCNVKDDQCNIFPNMRSDPILPDLTSYRMSLNTSHKNSTEITKYLSSIYLNPTYRDPRFLRRFNQDEISQVHYFNLF
jgi:hypothetical protein